MPGGGGGEGEEISAQSAKDPQRVLRIPSLLARVDLVAPFRVIITIMTPKGPCIRPEVSCTRVFLLRGSLS